MKKFLLNLLFLALFVPWATKTNAQCDNNAEMCAITVYMMDSYGDGWNNNSLEIYQGSTLRGTVTLASGNSSGSADVLVCPDSIRLEWVHSSYSTECGFVIVDGTGDTLYQVATGSLTNNSRSFGSVLPSCPSCVRPGNFAVASSDTNSLTLSWQGPTNAATYEIVYGPAGYDPETLYNDPMLGTVVSNITGQTTTINNVPAGILLDFFIRTNCSNGDNSIWTSLNNVALGIHTMAANSTDTLVTCAAVICDDGGISGNYSNNNNSTLYLYPASADSVIRISGTIITQANNDYLYIYDGIGTSGTLLFSGSGEMTIDPISSESGPITIVFTSNGYTNKAGYILSVSCAEAPACPRTLPLQVASLSNTEATISWQDTTYSYAYTLEYGLGSFEEGNGTVVSTSDTVYYLRGLQPNTEYMVYVRVECPLGGYSNSQSIRFRTTRCEPIALEDLPLIETFDNNGLDSCWTILSEDDGVEFSNGIMDFYAYYSYAAIAAPAMAEHVSTFQVSFNLKKMYSSSSADVEVGIMGNPNDINTFVGIATVSALSNSEWNRVNVFLNEYDGDGKFIALRAANDYSYVYIDSLVIELLPACSAPNNLRASNIGPNSAICRWEAGSIGSASQYEIEISEHGTNNWTYDVADGNFYSFNNLDLNTIYDVRVKAICNDGEAEYANMSFRTLGCTGPGVVDTNVAPSPIFVGDSSSSSNTIMNVPLRLYEKYNYTQQIFTVDELEGVGTITGVGFKKTTGEDHTRNISVYMATTSQNNLSSGFISDADFVLVYSGNYTFTNGWNRINFTTAFPYGGAGNVVLAMTDSSSTTAYAMFSSHYTGNEVMALCANNSSSAYHSIPTTGSTPDYYDNKRNNVFFYSYPCDTAAVSCAAPLATVIEANATYATIAWAAGAGEEEWKVEYKEESATDWIVATASTTESSYVLTGLDVNVNYVARVSALCGTTTMSTTVNFTTSCGMISTFPFVENFDNVTGRIPACWDWYSNAQSGNTWPAVTYFESFSGGKSLRLDCYDYHDNTTLSYVTLPQIDVETQSISDLRIEFKMLKTDDFYEEFAVIVGVMTDPTDSNTFRPVDTVFISANEIWQDAEVLFNNYNGTGSYIALMSRPFYDENTNDVYIDNVKVSLIPNCIRPTDISIENASANSADITWAATGASSYIVEYGVSGFQRGNGTKVTTSTNSITLTGLTVATNYDVYVRGLCGRDSSEYSFPVSFYTNCGTISTFPYTENFDTWATSGLQVPQCWTPGNNNDPTIYTYFGYQSSASLYMYTTEYAEDKTIVSMPQLGSQIPINSLQVSFKLYGDEQDYRSGVVVGVCQNPGDFNSFVALDTFYSSNGTWTDCEVVLDGYAGNGRYISFVGCVEVLENSDHWHFYNEALIDNIIVEVVPTCRRPNNLRAINATQNSVDLTWNHPTTNGNWVIEYGPVGFQLGTGTKIATTSNPYTLTGLNTTTSYEYYVRLACSVVDSSEYSSVGCRFSTSQVPASMPYSYNFENETEWYYWQTCNSPSSVNWYRGNDVAEQGSYSMYISSNNGTTSSSISTSKVNATAYRDIDFGTTDTNCILSFSAKIAGYEINDSYYDAFAVVLEEPSRIVSASNETSTTPWGYLNGSDVNVVAIISPDDTAWHRYELPLDNVSGIKRLAFYWYNASSSYYEISGDAAAVDNISITYTPCPRPTNLESVALAISANLSWSGSASGYVIYYRSSTDSVYQTAYSNSNSYTLTGLNPGGTNYIWAVRALCGVDTSIMSETSSFVTECMNSAITSFPFIENFEGNISCWDQSYGSGAEFVDWSLETTIDGNPAYNGEKFAKYKYPGSDAAPTMLISPVLDLSGLTNPYLKFAHIQPDWDGDQDTLGVYYRTHTNSDWVYLASYSNSIESWQIDSISLPNQSNTYQIGFFAQSDYGYGVGIDAVVVNGMGPACPDPVLTVNVVMNTANISWNEVGDYEIKYRKTSESAYGNIITAQGVSNYTLTELSPSTEYICAVRRDCGEEDGFSNWVEITFTTDEIPCTLPTDIVASNITYTSATISWTADETQLSWEVRCVNGALDTTIATTTTSVALSNLYPGETYSIQVRAYCGTETYSDWTEVYTFTTTACQTPTNVTISNINATFATVTWTPAEGQTMWEVSYGMEGVNEENGIKVSVSGTPSYTLEGLDPETKYDVYVRAICTDGIYSIWSNRTQFTTNSIGINSVANDNVNVRIYPNPANTEATISVDGISGKVEFVVADMNGRMIVTETIACEGSLVKSIDVSNLAKGAYFVHIYNDNFNTTRKLIVK